MLIFRNSSAASLMSCPPFEHSHVLLEAPLAHAPERPEEVPRLRLNSLQRAAMHLAHSVAVGIDRSGLPRPCAVRHHKDPPMSATDLAVADPRVVVQDRLLGARMVYDPAQLGRAGGGRAPPAAPSPTCGVPPRLPGGVHLRTRCAPSAHCPDACASRRVRHARTPPRRLSDASRGPCPPGPPAGCGRAISRRRPAWPGGARTSVFGRSSARGPVLRRGRPGRSRGG